MSSLQFDQRSTNLVGSHLVSFQGKVKDPASANNKARPSPPPPPTL